MFQSLLRHTIKPRGHEDAEKELDEVMDLHSKYPLYFAEGENSEFKNEYDRLRHEIQLHNAAKSVIKPRNVDKVLRDSRVLKYKVKHMIDCRKAAAVKAGVLAFPGASGDDQSVPQEINIVSSSARPTGDPSQTTNDPSNTVSNTPLATQPVDESSTGNGTSGQTEPASDLLNSNPPPRVPENRHTPAEMSFNQAMSLLRSRISYQVDSMIMEGATVEFPTANINSPGSTGATVISHSPKVTQGVPQPARPRQAASRRMQQQPSSFLSGGYVSSNSIICSNSRVTGATLNVNSRNASGAVFNRTQARV